MLRKHTGQRFSAKRRPIPPHEIVHYVLGVVYKAFRDHTPEEVDAALRTYMRTYSWKHTEGKLPEEIDLL
ncbi:MAG: hypothetical protein HYT73_05025 [Candidatus Aenigmarchaeota archaeon]|nr:hypothetical protein [Candidatus Aenigmarchaeota archaeon]